MPSGHTHCFARHSPPILPQSWSVLHALPPWGTEHTSMYRPLPSYMGIFVEYRNWDGSLGSRSSTALAWQLGQPYMLAAQVHVEFVQEPVREAHLSRSDSQFAAGMPHSALMVHLAPPLSGAGGQSWYDSPMAGQIRATVNTVAAATQALATAARCPCPVSRRQV